MARHPPISIMCTEAMGVAAIGRGWLGWGALSLVMLVVAPAVLARACVPRLSAPPVGYDLTVRVYVPGKGSLLALPLEEYVTGVVVAELPPAFADEALKAQAVAARTYAVRHMRTFGGRGCDLHPLADVCASPDNGQAYKGLDDLRRDLGLLAAYRFWERAAAAARATRGLILTYMGEPIEAVYHSASGKTTEDARAVWGQEVPYLRPVPDPYGTRAPGYVQTVTLTPADLARRLGVPLAVPAGGKSLPVAVLDRTPGGRAARVQVGPAVLPGTEFRRRLGLQSADVDVAWRDGQVVITARGKGHGVGMSQWGAQGMAEAGKTFQEILAHYYPGTRLEPIFDE